ncbi:hypothetical protein BsWGS_13884 [Bradybaena similaris]
MASTREAFFVLLLGVSFSGNGSGVGGMPFTEEEVQFFASMNLCEHFGGSCDAHCPYRYITHKWGVPLCPNDSDQTLQCCTGPAPVGNEETATASPDTTTETTTHLQITMTPAQEYDTCGKLEMHQPRRKKRIVGGMIAALESWPWLVGFRSLLGSHVCSGAIIAQRWVITAAHCFKHISSPSLWRVRIGDHNLLAQEIGEREINVQRIILNPGYRAWQHRMANQTLRARYEHDIALVRLSEDSLTEPICLPSPTDDSFITQQSDYTSESEPQDHESPDENNNIKSHSDYMDVSSLGGRFNEIPTMGFEGRQESAGSDEQTTVVNKEDGSCWVAGWGATLDATNTEQILHEVPGDVIGNQKCSDMWGENLESDMLCFGDGTYGPCLGDSGGPLSCEKDGIYYLVGVVSWGTEECNVVGYPSVFTNIQPYLTWIYEHMNKQM